MTPKDVAHVSGLTKRDVGEPTAFFVNCRYKKQSYIK